MERFALRHIKSGEFYSGMTLGADRRTAHEDGARAWSTRASAERFGARFGDRYEVVPIAKAE